MSAGFYRVLHQNKCALVYLKRGAQRWQRLLTVVAMQSVNCNKVYASAPRRVSKFLLLSGYVYHYGCLANA